MIMNEEVPRISLLSVAKIWDFADHNALTDLVRYHNRWFCAFRESNSHVYGIDGIIRILTSDDGVKWNNAALLQKEGVDLRDPKVSVTPEGKLMLLAGGTSYDNTTYLTRQPLVAFSEDGTSWSDLHTILAPHEWLW